MASQIETEQGHQQNDPEVSLKESKADASQLDDRSSEESEPVVTLKTWIVSAVSRNTH